MSHSNLSWTLLSACLVLLGCGKGTSREEVNERLLYAPERSYDFDQVDDSITYTSGDVLTPERTIPLRIRTPRGATGALPLVVVIHGGGFFDRGHQSLSDWGEQLAAAGYVTINFANATDEGVSHCAPLNIPLAECNGDLFQKEVAVGGTLPASVYSRPQDVKAILDRLAQVEQRASVVIDRDRIGVLGHSGGAHATLSLAGLVLDVSASLSGIAIGADARPRAFVANSPQGIGRLGHTPTSWASIDRPVLVQTGSGDNHEGEEAASRRDVFKGLAGPKAYEHFIDDPSALHAQFGLEQDPGVTGYEAALARTALAFFDAMLRDRAEAKTWLASEQLSRATGAVSKLSRK